MTWLRPPHMLFLLLVFATPAQGQGDYTRDWLYAHGPDELESGVGLDVVVDAEGNAYATGIYLGPGEVRDDILVLKLSPEGEVLWEDLVVASPGWDGGHAVALDGEGHLYVVADESESALLLRKYTVDGTLVWAQRYQRDGIGLSASEGRYHLALTGEGHLYVAATGYGPGGPGSTSADISVARFTAEGLLDWAHVYDGNGDYNPQSHNHILVAPDGGLYVTGQSAIDDLGPKFLVYRLTPDGALAWDLLVDGDDQGGDAGVQAALGPDGSVYVAGLVSNVPGGTRDATLLRIAADGTLLWRRDFDNPEFGGNGPDAYRGLAVDGDGNAYATGATWYGFTEQYHDVLVTKYAPDGALLWWDHVDAPGYTRDIGHHVLLDASGQPLVVAEVKNMEGLNFAHALIQYSPDGARLWAELGDIAVDTVAVFHGAFLTPDGTLYLSGTSRASSTVVAQFAVARYSRSTTTPLPPLEIPEAGFTLSAPSPNPFTASSRVTLAVAHGQAVAVSVYDALGRRIATLHEGWLGAGTHTFEIRGAAYPAGLYTVRAAGETAAHTRRLALVR